MMTAPTITIDMSRKCDECRKPGAVDNGLCLVCTTNALNGRWMRSDTGRLVRLRFTNMRTDMKRNLAAMRKQ